MSKQLDLFPDSSLNVSQSPREENLSDLETMNNPIDEVFLTTARLHSWRSYIDLLNFLARFPNYSPFNGFLLFIQNPSATYVATARTWLQKFRRRPRQDARPMAILAPMAPILFVFDVDDTEGIPVPSNLLKSPEISVSFLGKRYENTLHNCRIQGIAVHETTLNRDVTDTASRLTPSLRKKYEDLNLAKDTSYLILLDKTQSLQDKYALLAYELGHIFCGHLGIDRHAWWPKRRDLNIDGEAFEAESVAFLVSSRNGLKLSAQNYVFNQQHDYQKLPPFSLNAVIQAVHYVEKMSTSLWKKPRKESRY
ncbi:MAG: hypothetical protein PVG70_18365 [Desulfobacterales bacterium]|jgi:hypothetical protein